MSTENQARMSAADLMSTIVRAIVDNPAAVEIQEFENGLEPLVLELRVAKKDTARVIGKGGKMAESLRNILAAVSTRLSRRVTLVILDDQSPPPVRAPRERRPQGRERA